MNDDVILLLMILWSMSLFTLPSRSFRTVSLAGIQRSVTSRRVRWGYLVLARCCLGLIFILSWSSIHLIFILSSYYLGLIFILSWSYLHLIFILSWSYLHLILVLSSSYIHLVLVLYS